MPLKGLSFDEIVKKEIKEGKDQNQAVAIAYSVTGRDNMLTNRVKRGEYKYGSFSHNAKEEFEVGDKVTILMGNNAGRQGMVTGCQPYGNYDILLSTGLIVSANGKDMEAR